MNTNSKIVLGIAGAAVAGALIGLMVAPEKGSIMRSKVSNNARDLFSRLSDWIFEKGKEVVDATKNKMEATAEKLSDDTGSEWNKSKKTSLI